MEQALRMLVTAACRNLAYGVINKQPYRADGLQNDDMEHVSIEVLTRLNPCCDPRPDARLIHVNPSVFYCKKLRKVVIQFVFGPLTTGIGGQPSTGGNFLGRVIDDIINRECLG